MCVCSWEMQMWCGWKDAQGYLVWSGLIPILIASPQVLLLLLLLLLVLLDVSFSTSMCRRCRRRRSPSLVAAAVAAMPGDLLLSPLFPASSSRAVGRQRRRWLAGWLN